MIRIYPNQVPEIVLEKKGLLKFPPAIKDAKLDYGQHISVIPLIVMQYGLINL